MNACMGKYRNSPVVETDSLVIVLPLERMNSNNFPFQKSNFREGFLMSVCWLTGSYLTKRRTGWKSHELPQREETLPKGNYSLFSTNGNGSWDVSEEALPTNM